jgi:3-hydroxyisobutyrate dehydrogenase-like beta-hydroxyacid dehydrogenase
MSTVSPQASRRVAERVGTRAGHMLDAPVSGSIPQAESGALAIMVGGEPQAFAAVEPLLRELGQTVTHIGPNGQGLVLKLAINSSLAVQTLAFSEGLLLAERAGVDPEVAAGAMSASSIGSPMLKARIPLLLHPPEHAWFDVALMQKDIRLARDAADDLQIPLPSATVADQILTRARNLGYANHDLASLHAVLAETAAETAGEPSSTTDP